MQSLAFALFFFLMSRPPRRSPLFPSTTLFRPAPASLLLPERLSTERLRAAFELIASLHFAADQKGAAQTARSEEHTSELQSRQYLVCRLLLEKKKHTEHYYSR